MPVRLYPLSFVCGVLVRAFHLSPFYKRLYIAAVAEIIAASFIFYNTYYNFVRY